MGVTAHRIWQQQRQTSSIEFVHNCQVRLFQN